VPDVPRWDSGSEISGGNPVGRTFTLFKLPSRYPAFPDNSAGAQQYADTCAVYGLQTIGCDSRWPGINSVTPRGMGMPSSWSCQIDGPLRSKTAWTSVAVLSWNGGMFGLNAEGGSVDDPGAGYAPVCALAH
jgi:hypothetical protein